MMSLRRDDVQAGLTLVLCFVNGMQMDICRRDVIALALVRKGLGKM